MLNELSLLLPILDVQFVLLSLVTNFGLFEMTCTCLCTSEIARTGFLTGKHRPRSRFEQHAVSGGIETFFPQLPLWTRCL